MQQPPLPTPPPATAVPSFYLTGRQPLRPAALLLATVAAVAALSSVLYALDHTGHVHLSSGSPGAAGSSGERQGGSSKEDEKDDPSQVDTIVLGDPAEAPAPARRGDHVSPVHPTIIVRLPRFGDQVGLIPDTASGRLLYSWLAAFNQASAPALASVLPSAAPGSVVAAQLALRQETGGFTLLSAREVQPGVLVFRLRDQTPQAAEVLGTLAIQPETSPAAVASFSLRSVGSPAQNGPGAASAPNAIAP